MKGQRIGYLRVSATDQNTARQLDGIEVDRVFTDRASGKDVQRPALEEMMAYVRQGDTVLVHSMDRLARNLDDLRQIVQRLTHKGVVIEFIKEHLRFTGEDTPMANLMLTVMGAFAEFERALIRERQREGIAQARKRGAYRGRKPVLSRDRLEEVRRLAASGMGKAALARQFGVSRQTIYKALEPAIHMQQERADESGI